jgi:multidrug efflux pump subunit AcrA (membrane-fusion protein)
MRAQILGIVGLTAAGLALAAACNRPGEAPAAPEKESSAISLSAEAAGMSGVKIEAVRRMSLESAVTSTGVVGFNQRRYACVSSRIAATLEGVDAFEGDRVREGQSLAALYSADYLAAQQDLLQLLGLRDHQTGEAGTEAAAMTERLVRSAEGRVRLMGAGEGDVRTIIETRTPQSLLVLRAPFAGTIVSGSAAPGRQVQAGADLFEIADLDTLWVTANLHEKDLSLVTPGCSASVSVPAWPGESFPGRLTAIGDVQDETTRTVKARVEIANPRRKLKPGMFAQVRLTCPAGERVLAVPETAVRDVEGRAVVFQPGPGNTFTPRPVKVGRRAEGWVEVLEGLREGDEVVTQGSFSLKAELLKKTLEGEE